MISNDKSNAFIKRIASAVGVSLLMAVCIAGCGKDSSEGPYVSVDKEGKVKGVLYEEFDRDYYDVDELKDMSEKEIEGYNAEYDTPRITLEEAQVVNDGAFVRLSMNYESTSDYSYFNQADLFYGTIEEAEDAGYIVSKKLVNDKGEKIEPSFIEDNKSRHIIITGDKNNIKTPYNIVYMSEGVKLIDKKEAALSAVTKDSVQLLLSK